MAALTGAVVVVGTLCLLDLLLTLGVIRRLREHTAMLARTRPSEPLAIGLPPGKSPEPFMATTTEGADVSGPAGLSVVAFFSTSCPVCPKQAPVFVDYLRAQALKRDEVLAVVTGQAAASVPYFADLADVAHICTEPPDGEIGTAFGVRGFPAFFVLDAAGIVTASDFDPAALPATITA
jgi:Redoxin